MYDLLTLMVLRTRLFLVVAVKLVEGHQRHARRALHLAQEVHLPCACGLLGLKAALGLPEALPRPILVPALT